MYVRIGQVRERRGELGRADRGGSDRIRGDGEAGEGSPTEAARSSVKWAMMLVESCGSCYRQPTHREGRHPLYPCYRPSFFMGDSVSCADGRTA